MLAFFIKVFVFRSTRFRTPTTEKPCGWQIGTTRSLGKMEGAHASRENNAHHLTHYRVVQFWQRSTGDLSFCEFSHGFIVFASCFQEPLLDIVLGPSKKRVNIHVSFSAFVRL